MLFSLLMNRWVQIAIAIGLTAIIVGPWQRYVGYSKEHKERLIEVAELKDRIAIGEIKAAKLAEAADEAIEESDKRLIEVSAQLEATRQALKVKIKQYEELRRITVPARAVELFNESTNAGVQRGQGIQIKTDSKDDVKAGPTETDFASFLEVVVENNLNHLAAIQQVEELQLFICGLYTADGQPLDFEVCKKKEPSNEQDSP